MTAFVAALPMYDWPQVRADIDRHWSILREKLRAAGVDAPDTLARRNADLPPVAAGVCDFRGTLALAPDDFDLQALWRHPGLLLAQTCWGPMELGLSQFVEVVGQPDYSDFEGGEGIFYSSVVLMRREDGRTPLPSPPDGRAILPVESLRGRRLAFNGPDSMSGYLALKRDLEAIGERMSVFAEAIETGGHRASMTAAATGLADVCAVDCRSWAMAKRFDDVADALTPIGWTTRRKGLPYVASVTLPSETIAAVRAALKTQST